MYAMRCRVRSVPHSCRKTSRSKSRQVALLYLPARPTTSGEHPCQTAPYNHVVLAELPGSPAFI